MTFKTYNLGCKVNAYECAGVRSLLIKEGLIYDEKNPDVVIINSCSVTHVADAKSRHYIRKLKKDNPNSILCVMGCSAQNYAKNMVEECGADIVIGTDYRTDILSLILEYKNNHQSIIKIRSNARECEAFEDFGNVICFENVRAYLKIQDGCDNFCSYCIVPYRRGKSRSRNFNSIISEAKALISAGYKEIVLTGIHVGGYGKDIGLSFSYLIKKLIEIDGDFRIRISSIEESEIDDDLIEMMSQSNKIAKHLHIPLQSGSSSILKLMARKYDSSQFIRRLNYIRSKMPNVCLSSDVIVGFPGETEECFLETIDTIKKAGLNQLHVFPYSIREGTPAAKMPIQIDSKVKQERVHVLLELSKTLWSEYEKLFINKTVEVLFEQKIGSKLFGHSSNYLEVYSDNSNYKIGERVDIAFKK